MQRILLTGLLLWPLAVSALTFQERMETVEWQVDGNRFECKLVQPILRFGQGEFVRRAGVKPVFRLRSQEALLRQGQAELLSAPPSWNPRGSNLMLGSVMVAGNERQIETTEEQAGRLLTGLLQGRAPVLRHQTVQGDPVEIRLQPVNFADAYDRYLECAKELLPVNYEQIKLTAVRFNSGYVLDDKAQAHLDILLEFIAEDPAINRIRLDGHSDNRGIGWPTGIFRAVGHWWSKITWLPRALPRTASKCFSMASVIRSNPTTRTPTAKKTAASPSSWNGTTPPMS